MASRKCPYSTSQGAQSNPGGQPQPPPKKYVPCPVHSKSVEQPQPASPQFRPSPSRSKSVAQPQRAPPQYIPCPSQSKSAEQRQPAPPQFRPCPSRSKTVAQPQPAPPQYVPCPAKEQQSQVPLESPPAPGIQMVANANGIDIDLPYDTLPASINANTRRSTSNSSPTSRHSMSGNQSPKTQLSKATKFVMIGDEVSFTVPNNKEEESSQPVNSSCLCANKDVPNEEDEEPLIKITMEVQDDPNERPATPVSISQTPQSINIRVGTFKKQNESQDQRTSLSDNIAACYCKK